MITQKNTRILYGILINIAMMTFKEYIETFNKKKKKKKVLKKKTMDRLDSPDQAYLTHQIVIPNYPNVTQPAGGPVGGVGPVIA